MVWTITGFSDTGAFHKVTTTDYHETMDRMIRVLNVQHPVVLCVDNHPQSSLEVTVVLDDEDDSTTCLF